MRTWGHQGREHAVRRGAPGEVPEAAVRGKAVAHVDVRVDLGAVGAEVERVRVGYRALGEGWGKKLIKITNLTIAI